MDLDIRGSGRRLEIRLQNEQFQVEAVAEKKGPLGWTVQYTTPSRTHSFDVVGYHGLPAVLRHILTRLLRLNKHASEEPEPTTTILRRKRSQ